MYLLSIIPVGLAPGIKPIDPSDKIEVVEVKIKNLEGLLTSEYLGGTFDADPYTAGDQRLDDKYYGSNGVKVYLVKKDLEDARKEDLELRKELGMTGSNINRLAEIHNKLAVADQRLRDLNGLAEALKKGEVYDADPNTPGIQGVSGVNNHDLNEVIATLEITNLYNRTLEDAKTFWKSLNPVSITT